jgi:hypothetical protein
MQKLPVFATVAHTYRAAFGELGSIYRACWPWLLVLTPVAGYLAFFEAQDAAPEVAHIKVIWSVWGNVATISLAVAWQRYMVIGTPLRFLGSNLRDRSFWRHVGVGLKIGLFTIFPAALVILAVTFIVTQTLGVAQPIDMPRPYFVSLLIFDVFLVVLAFAGVFRFSPLLPARAADDLRSSFRSVWNRTRGNTWRLVMTSVLCALPSYLFATFGVYLASDEPSGTSPLSPHIFPAVAMVATLLYPIAVCLAFGALASTYNHLVRADAAPEMSTEARLRT